ncbi:MAG: hypothetical protein A3G20_09170 [Acidobacteria bacterium RIFCSPLOWO2_12_FULL_59_11]|nr:MAG: hypothetical protein A3G20_09170 [Acidobacteria bacterium RIFCSPLOWO2_12_FULL_59_11]
MTDDGDIDELKTRRICFHCVSEKYLQAEIQSKGERGLCSYCNETAETYSLQDLSEYVFEAFEHHYFQLDDADDDGTPVVDAIEDAASIPREAAEYIQQILADDHYDHGAAKDGEQCAFSDDSFYEERGVDVWAWQEEWSTFERSLKSEARFFSRSASAHLASVFGGIDKMNAGDGRPLVVDGGPGTEYSQVYRARVFQSDRHLINALCHPDQQLGSPSMLNAGAGRMNARGISVFYGANDTRVAIAEVRPPVGSQVAVARFDIIRPVRLLDLAALSYASERGSIFESGFAQRLERAAFLRSLTDRMIRPVMPDDEVLDYLPTQAIADFLATENEPTLDGIVFPSVQAVGEALNIVLFHKAARVAPIDLPKGNRLSARTGMHGAEGWEPGYSLTEHPPEKSAAIEDNGPPFNQPLLGDIWPDDPDARKPALRIDLTSLHVHVVRGVTFECDEHEVHWSGGM